MWCNNLWFGGSLQIIRLQLFVNGINIRYRVPSFRTGSIHHVDDNLGPLNMPQELMSKTNSFRRALWEYLVEGPRIEKMLGYTNLDSEKGFAFFQNFLKQAGILAELEKLGIEEGDTVRMYGLVFDYYK